MAQADQTVQNATFPTVRADINNNLAALFSANSGNTAPSVTVAFQDWIDTSGANPLWKKRNAANNAWITLGTISASTIAFEGTLPSQSGNADKYLSTDGTVASWESVLSLGSIITAGTSVASTSGTSIDFTGLPSWVKRITVMFNGVSTDATGNKIIQIGTSGGVETTGYASGCRSGLDNLTTTVGFLFDNASSNTFLLSGHAIITKISGNTWIFSSVSCNTTTGSSRVAGGTKNLSATLDRIRITTVNGTDTFDAGSINILYEG
jgi:hypothetical protein